MPDVYIEKLLKFIAFELESTRHIHFYLLWIETILTKRGSQINTALQMPKLIMLQKNMQKKYDDLSKMLVLLFILNYIYCLTLNIKLILDILTDVILINTR